MISMDDKQKFAEEIKQLKTAIDETIKNWRLGNDHKGFQQFMQLIKSIEKITPSINNLSPILHNLHEKVKDQDVIGITDTLEFQLAPLVDSWEKDVAINAPGS